MQGGQLIVAGNPVQPPTAIQNSPSVVTITLPATGQTPASRYNFMAASACHRLPSSASSLSVRVDKNRDFLNKNKKKSIFLI